MANKKKKPAPAAQGWSEKKKNIVTIAVLVAFVALIVGICVVAINCGKSDSDKADDNTTNSPETLEPSTSGLEVSETPTDYVQLTVQYVNSQGQVATGDIVVHLRADAAPITVQNFKDLVASGFYNGLTFHRIVSGFMIQGGDPKGNGTGGSENTIKGEFSENGVANPLSHTRGVISMARSASYDSASSQFFIMHATNAKLDGQYAAFGEVYSGMDVVDGIANTSVTYGSDGNLSKPLNPPKILKACFVTVPDAQ